MKVEIKKVASSEDEKALIHAVTVSEDIQSAIDILENNRRTITVYQNGGAVFQKLQEKVKCTKSPAAQSDGRAFAFLIWYQSAGSNPRCRCNRRLRR